MNTGVEPNKLPTIHEAFIQVAEQQKKQIPKCSLPEAFEASKEPFAQKHGIEYSYSYRTFLSHYYEKIG